MSTAIAEGPGGDSRWTSRRNVAETPLWTAPLSRDNYSLIYSPGVKNGALGQNSKSGYGDFPFSLGWGRARLTRQAKGFTRATDFPFSRRRAFPTSGDSTRARRGQRPAAPGHAERIPTFA